MYYVWNFTVKKTKKWFKITFLNWFNDYVYCKNENELNKLYRISNEYNISRSKKDIIDYMNWIVNFWYYDK
jgi:hypothetical protein